MNIAVFLIVVILAASFAWGMRGDLIGGEEGAMLPGAWLGLCIAMLFGNQFMSENFYVFSALGMLGIFIGGAETYAETLSFSFWGDGFNPKPESMAKGMVGVAVKGAVWFGFCAAVMGIGFTSMTVKPYKWYEFIILICVLMLVRFLGTVLLNRPCDAEKGKFPKLYFSKTRPEEWGGMLFMLISMVVFALLHKDYFACKLTLFGVAGGSIGWVIAQFFHSASRKKFRNGKYLFGKFNEKGYVDSWKNMEFTLGAIGGLAIALGFLVQRDTVESYTLRTTAQETDFTASTVVFAVLISLYALSNLFKYRSEKALKICELINRPILCYLPMTLIFMGNYQVAKICTFVVLPWMAMEENCFVQLRNCGRKIKVLATVDFIAFACLMVSAFLIETPSSKMFIILFFVLVSLLYVVCAFTANAAKIAKNKGSFELSKNRTLISVYSYYIFCIAAVTVLLII